MAVDGSHTIYVGRQRFLADSGTYAVGTQNAGQPWISVIDTRRMKPPYNLFVRFVSVGTAVTTTLLQAKLQHACLIPAERGVGGLAKTAIPATAWRDAEAGTTAIETVDMTSTAAAEKSNVCNEQLGDAARVLIKVTSGGWQTGIDVDVWLKGSTA